jgi:hypothetical protein
MKTDYAVASTTTFRPLVFKQNYLVCLVKVTPGQIQLQSASAGCPLLADMKLDISHKG